MPLKEVTITIHNSLLTTAFDKVCHPRLLFKIHQIFLTNIIWSHFIVYHKSEVTGMTKRLAEVQQESVLSRIL